MRHHNLATSREPSPQDLFISVWIAISTPSASFEMDTRLFYETIINGTYEERGRSKSILSAAIEQGLLINLIFLLREISLSVSNPQDSARLLSLLHEGFLTYSDDTRVPMRMSLFEAVMISDSQEARTALFEFMNHALHFRRGELLNARDVDLFANLSLTEAQLSKLLKNITQLELEANAGNPTAAYYFRVLKKNRCLLRLMQSHHGLLINLPLETISIPVLSAYVKEVSLKEGFKAVAPTFIARLALTRPKPSHEQLLFTQRFRLHFLLNGLPTFAHLLSEEPIFKVEEQHGCWFVDVEIRLKTKTGKTIRIVLEYDGEGHQNTAKKDKARDQCLLKHIDADEVLVCRYVASAQSLEAFYEDTFEKINEAVNRQSLQEMPPAPVEAIIPEQERLDEPRTLFRELIACRVSMATLAQEHASIAEFEDIEKELLLTYSTLMEQRLTTPTNESQEYEFLNDLYALHEYFDHYKPAGCELLHAICIARIIEKNKNLSSQEKQQFSHQGLLLLKASARLLKEKKPLLGYRKDVDKPLGSLFITNLSAPFREAHITTCSTLETTIRTAFSITSRRAPAFFVRAKIDDDCFKEFFEHLLFDYVRCGKVHSSGSHYAGLLWMLLSEQDTTAILENEASAESILRGTIQTVVADKIRIFKSMLLNCEAVDFYCHLNTPTPMLHRLAEQYDLVVSVSDEHLCFANSVQECRIRLPLEGNDLPFEMRRFARYEPVVLVQTIPSSPPLRVPPAENDGFSFVDRWEPTAEFMEALTFDILEENREMVSVPFVKEVAIQIRRDIAQLRLEKLQLEKTICDTKAERTRGSDDINALNLQIHSKNGKERTELLEKRRKLEALRMQQLLEIERHTKRVDELASLLETHTSDFKQLQEQKVYALFKNKMHQILPALAKRKRVLPTAEALATMKREKSREKAAQIEVEIREHYSQNHELLRKKLDRFFKEGHVTLESPTSKKITMTLTVPQTIDEITTFHDTREGALFLNLFNKAWEDESSTFTLEYLLFFIRQWDKSNNVLYFDFIMKLLSAKGFELSGTMSYLTSCSQRYQDIVRFIIGSYSVDGARQFVSIEVYDSYFTLIRLCMQHNKAGVFFKQLSTILISMHPETKGMCIHTMISAPHRLFDIIQYMLDMGDAWFLDTVLPKLFSPCVTTPHEHYSYETPAECAKICHRIDSGISQMIAEMEPEESMPMSKNGDDKQADIFLDLITYSPDLLLRLLAWKSDTGEFFYLNEFISILAFQKNSQSDPILLSIAIVAPHLLLTLLQMHMEPKYRARLLEEITNAMMIQHQPDQKVFQAVRAILDTKSPYAISTLIAEIVRDGSVLARQRLQNCMPPTVANDTMLVTANTYTTFIQTALEHQYKFALDHFATSDSNLLFLMIISEDERLAVALLKYFRKANNLPLLRKMLDNLNDTALCNGNSQLLFICSVAPRVIRFWGEWLMEAEEQSAELFYHVFDTVTLRETADCVKRLARDLSDPIGRADQRFFSSSAKYAIAKSIDDDTILALRPRGG